MGRDFFFRYRVQRGSGAHFNLPYNGFRSSFPGASRPVREADKSTPSSVKNAWNYKSTPQYVLMVWYLIKNNDKFTLTIVINLPLPLQ
jgi:hypothetical protein